MTIRIFDINGRLVKQISSSISSGFNTIPISESQLRALKAGAYVLEVKQGSL